MDCINGAAAHRIRKGDRLIVMGSELTDRPIEAEKVRV